MRLEAAAVSGIAAVFFAALMLFQRSLYSAAVCLLAVMVQIAFLFALSGSPFLGLMQMMIYAGALMVLVVVAIMAFPKTPEPAWGRVSFPKSVVFLALAAFFVELIKVVGIRPPAAGPSAPAAPTGAAVGAALFSSYAPAVEAATFLMFLAGLALIKDRKNS